MDEKRRIIEMLAEKKISAEEAAKLLNAVGKTKNEVGKKKKFLKIMVSKDTKSKPIVNISIPILLIKLGLKFIPKEQMLDAKLNDTNFDFSSIDWDELLKVASQEEVGDLFNAEIEEDDGSTTKVRIYVE